MYVTPETFRRHLDWLRDSFEPIPLAELVACLAEGRAILQVKTNPPKAEVQLDGHVLGETPTLSAKLPAGKHTLTINHKYFRPYEEEVELVDDKVLKRDITLLPGRGSVTLLSDPPNAQIFISGELQAERTPATIADIAAGEHEIRLAVLEAPARDLERVQ